MSRYALAAILLLATEAFAFQAASKNATPAKLIKKVTPVYPTDAQQAGVQGTVVLETVIDEHGVPTQIRVISPAGYGLDESAVDAVSKWRYQPTTVDGKPVSVLTNITVNFSLTNSEFNQKLEKQRTTFNIALRGVQEKKITKATLDSLNSLVSQNFGPALYLYGKLLQGGVAVSADPQRGFMLIQEAAGKQYGPAQYEVAIAYLKGDLLASDPAKGIELMRSAAKLSSQGAQLFLGIAYEEGQGVPVDLERSKENFRLCAAAGQAQCQYRLGKSLLEHPDRPDRDYAQAIAWLMLASDQQIEDAEKILEQEDQRMTPAQVVAANRLKGQLVHRQ